MANTDKPASGAGSKGASAAKKTAAKKTAAKTSSTNKAAAADQAEATQVTEQAETEKVAAATAKKGSEPAAQPVDDTTVDATTDSASEAAVAADLADTQAAIAETREKIQAAREELASSQSSYEVDPAPESFAYGAPGARVQRYPGEASLGRVFAAEFFGAFVLVLAGLGIGMYNAVTQMGGLAVALGFGLGVTISAYAFGWISGGHFNPAVTLGAAIAGRIRWARLGWYWLAQLVGSFAAAGLLWVIGRSFNGAEGVDAAQLKNFRDGLFKSVANDFGANATGSTVLQFPLVTALLAEVVVTAVFILVILGVTSKRANNKFAPLAIGLTLAVGLMILMPITNGSMNPTRSLAAAAFAGIEQIKDVWVFVVAPLVGGALGGLLYPLFAGFGSREDEQ